MTHEHSSIYKEGLPMAWSALTVTVLWCLFVAPDLAMAQGASQPGALQMRHFWHVFAAYALAWVLLLGWIVSIFRRIRKVEKLLDS